MIAVDSSYRDVLSNPTKYHEEPEKLCSVGIMLNIKKNGIYVIIILYIGGVMAIEKFTRTSFYNYH